MSKYIKKLETDYDEGKISRDEFINSKLDYYKNWDTVKYEELKNELNNEKNDFNKSKNKILSKKTTNDNSNNVIKNEYFLFNVMVFMFYWFSKVLITYSSLPSYYQEGNFFRISMEKLATIIAVFVFSLIISSVIKAFTKTSFFKILFWIFLCTILFQELAI